jgi:hypothetical protein
MGRGSTSTEPVIIVEVFPVMAITESARILFSIAIFLFGILAIVGSVRLLKENRKVMSPLIFLSGLVFFYIIWIVNWG